MSTVEEMNAFNPYELASLADVAGPDSHGSAGAVWLVGIRDAVIEAVLDSSNVGKDWADVAMEAVSDAVPVYTHPKWLVFIDLAAYREEVSEVTDFDAAANTVLGEIAERLAMAIVDDLDNDADAEDAS